MRAVLSTAGVGVASDVTLQQIGGSWSYSATATPSNNQYYLVGALEHEITEVMGRTSYLPVRNEYGVMDLYRYKASGVRQTGTGGPAYFSTNSGATNLDNWNTQAGGDIGDWAGSAGADAFLAFNPSGQISGLTATDQTLMSALGWTTRVYFAPGLPLNLVYTAIGSTLPAPMPGQFNLELFNNGTGTGSVATASGYQGVALVSADGRTVSLLHGDYGAVDNGAGNTIFLGDGSESIGGAVGDTILGGSGANQFLDGHLGHQSITGGTAGNEMIWGAATDTVRGGGGNETIAGVPGETTFGSSGANVFINATGGNQSVLGGSAGNDSVWTAAGDTIHGGGNNATVGGIAGVTMVGGTGGNQFFDASQGHQSVLGGSGGNETIWGAATDTITGGSAGNETIGGVAGESVTGGAANTVIDASAGSQWIALGGGNSTVSGGAHDTILGSSGSGSAHIAFAGGNETLWDNGSTTSGHDSVTNFSQAVGDRVSLATANDTVSAVLASATSDLGGNVVLHLQDNSSITLVGVTPLMLNSGFFTTH